MSTPFETACDLLPEGVMWGDPITPDIATDIASRGRDELVAALRNVSEHPMNYDLDAVRAVLAKVQP